MAGGSKGGQKLARGVGRSMVEEGAQGARQTKKTSFQGSTACLIPPFHRTIACSVTPGLSFPPFSAIPSLSSHLYPVLFMCSRCTILLRP